MVNKLNVKSYGGYKSDNYGVNSLMVTDSGIEYYYSYTALIGIKSRGILKCIRNYWGKTTGKHLNWLDGGNKKDRLTSEEFQKYVELETEGCRAGQNEFLQPSK